MDTQDEAADLPYLVPTHLQQAQSIGPIPVRAFFVALGVGLLLGAPAATLGRRELGDVGLWLVLVPLVLAIPFSLPWLDPPAEHGADLAHADDRAVVPAEPAARQRRARMD